jgi:nicotinamide riboside kinase
MTQIKKFAILGERCSGTNFLEESITNNFNIEYTAEYGNKHFFCYNNYEMNSTKETLFIGIIRNPIYWINSFSKELYHVPEINKNINNFLFNEFYSVEEKFKNTDYLSNNIFVMNNNLNSTPKLNHKDLNYLNGKKYTNIFELRKVKNNFLMNVMPNKVKNYILINYEDLLFNYTQTLQIIKDKFGLHQKIPEFIRIKKYKKSDTYNFVKQREITLPVNIIQIIWNNLNVEQEKSLGYIPGDNNIFFKNKYINLSSV